MIGMDLRRAVCSLLTAALIISCTAGVVCADETISVSPSMVLNFSSVPDEIFDNCTITLTATSSFSDDLVSELNSIENFDVSNAAYIVDIAVENINLSEVSECCVYMPTSHEWNPKNNSVRAVVFSNESFSLKNVSYTAGNETVFDEYAVSLTYVPDSVVLVSGAAFEVYKTVVPTTSAPVNTSVPVDTETPTPTSSPLPVFGALIGLAAVCIILRIKND